MLGVHFVILYIICLYRAESTETDMECNEADFYPLCLYFLKQFFGKMKPRRRSSRRAELTRINSLITFFIVKMLGYVMRQRHFADFIKCVKKVYTRISEFCYSVAVRQNAEHFCLHNSVAENKSCALFGSFAGTCENLPHIFFFLIEKQKLNLCARSLFYAVNSGREHARIV